MKIKKVIKRKDKGFERACKTHLEYDYCWKKKEDALKEFEAEIDKIANSYARLEDTGHLKKGQITETINWDEIKTLFRRISKKN